MFFVKRYFPFCILGRAIFAITVGEAKIKFGIERQIGVFIYFGELHHKIITAIKDDCIR